MNLDWLKTFIEDQRQGFESGKLKKQTEQKQQDEANAKADEWAKNLSQQQIDQEIKDHKSLVEARNLQMKEELHKIKLEQETLKLEQMKNPTATPTKKLTPTPEPSPEPNSPDQEDPLSWIADLLGISGDVQGATSDTPTQPSPTMAPTATPTPNQPDLEMIAEALKKGFNDYSLKSGYDNPLATMSAEMAKAGQDANLPDPYLPATINLKETTGGKFMSKPNNYFNWSNNPLPDIQSAINRVYQGIGSTAPTGTFDQNGYGGLYKDYLKSGNLEDFFKVYTPSSDPLNPSYEDQIKQYKQLRGYFPSL